MTGSVASLAACKPCRLRGLGPKTHPEWAMAYFDHVIDGVRLDLAHLEPRRLTFFVDKIGRALSIEVRFSNHCFTVGFDDERHDRQHLIWDHRSRRAYDPARHELSRRLPAIVDALPGASVYMTPTDRNYVYLANVVLADGACYPMYFSLRRAAPGHRQQLLIVVESAYPVQDRRRVLAGTTKISFAVLCAKVYQGDRVRPRARR